MIANNFSKKYINPRGDPYTELPGDDQSSENTESDTVAEETEKEPTLFQKFKELLSDVACFTRPTTPFVQVNSFCVFQFYLFEHFR